MQSQRLKQIAAWVIIAVFTSTNSWATTNVLADSPLVSGLGKVISPNIFFILDDSGSMGSEYMPDGINSNSSKLCYRNFGYNTIYYNPAITYTPPLNSDGTSYAASTFTAAYKDGYNTGSGTDDLSATTTNNTYGTITAGPVALASNPIATTNNARTLIVTHGALPDGHVLVTGDSVTLAGMTGTLNNVNLANLNLTFTSITVLTTTTFSVTYTNAQGSKANSSSGSGGGSSVKATYSYTGIVSSTTTPNFYYAIYSASPTSPPTGTTCTGDASFTKVTATSYQPTGRTVAAEQTNFANWYTYYRTRLMMMKTAVGQSFAGVSDKYRVGFTVISDTGMSATKFLGNSKFDSTQKSSWYSTLYGISANSYTPLRGALSKAGRYYAGTLQDSGGTAIAGTNKDPVQYSCQQNYTILTTDGYWNTNSESSTYGPKNIDNSANVGNQDGSGVPRPQLDDKNASNTLADVAEYFYKTDLRPNTGNGGLTDEGTHLDVSPNNVHTASDSDPKFQHMVTFTMGLGTDGTLPHTDATLTALTQGTTQWPDPIASGEGPTRIDDLWHAAINGHGTYFSAKDSSAVKQSLMDTLSKISATVGAASAAATSNLQPVSGGDNTAYIAQYQTQVWVGDLLARKVDPGTGVIDTANIWSAQAQLDTQVAASTDSRTIYTFSSAAANKLKAFTPANLTTEKSSGYFKASQLTQYSGWTSTQKTAATDDSVINYLRGQTGNQQTGGTADTDLYRSRLHALGDIASSAPVYVGKSPFAYTDAGYASFLGTTATRSPTVYVGGNDGMLHAIDATTGETNSGKERWAYIPTTVIPNLYRLADQNYADNHRFFVDGPITVGDAYSGTAWATILIGGLGHGGRGYYAIDVTDPNNPKALWEFGTTQDSDLGYTYGNPVLTKRLSDGKWVVIFASGYNNSSPGDAKGRLYVVDAFTGAKLSEIITDSTVNDEQRSGIARVSNYVESGLIDNSTQYVYGGDLDGALWRFDITASSNAGVSLMLGRTAAAGARTQPITVQPELAKIRDGAGTWWRVVYFGTGRYLGPNDITSSDPSNGKAQGIYAVKDTGASPAAGVTFVDAAAKLVKQTLDTTTTPRTINPLQAVDWQTDNGWYVTTPSNERFNVDPGLQLGTLVIASNIPEQDYCHSTGQSVLYQLNYKSGNILKVNEYDEQIVGNTQLQTNGGAGPVVINPVFGDGTTGNTTQVGGAAGAGGLTRVSWREIQ